MQIVESIILAILKYLLYIKYHNMKSEMKFRLF